MNEYFVLVHKKITLKTIGRKTVFDEMWYIVEYFIVNLFYFLIVVDWKNPETIFFKS